MDEQDKLEAPQSNARPGDDPWLAFSYLVAGVGVYGFIGWALGRWLHAYYLTPIGIVTGMFFGLYLVYVRFVRAPSGDATAESGAAPNKLSHTRPDVSEGVAPTDMPSNDDRGDTA